MKFEGLKLYLENLFPGIVILGSLIILIPATSISSQGNALVKNLLRYEFLLSVFFIACAYTVGLVSAIVARVVVDFASDLFPRPLLLKIFSHRSYDEIKHALTTLPDKNQNWRLRWNKAYRLALNYAISKCSDQVAIEIYRRREQGRIVRSLFFPILLASYALSGLFQIEHKWLLISVGAIISVFLYSYAEYSTFAEAILHLPNINSPKITRKMNEDDSD